MDTTPLRNLGLSDGEISTYLTVLKLNIATAGPIIKETGFQSSSIYHILNSLIQKGIISFEMKNRRKYFYAVSPERLLDFLEAKKSQIEIEKKQVEKILPELLAFKHITKMQEQSTLVFEGWNGMLSAFNEAYKQLKPGTMTYAYTITTEFGGSDAKQVRWLINKVRDLRNSLNRKYREKITMKIIAERGSEIAKDQAKTRFTEVRFIDASFVNPTVVNIYGDVTILALWLKKPIAFYITSKEVSQSFRNNFNLLWDIARS